MRVLFVSSYFPDDPDRRTSGTYQRMGVFVDALKEIADLDMLFFVPDSISVEPASVARYREKLSRHWQTDLTLTLCPMEPAAGSTSRWKAYGPGALSFRHQPPYRRMSSARHVRALEERLAVHPDAVFIHRLYSMSPLMRVARRDLPPVYFDLDDIEHVARWRSIRQPPTWLGKYLYLLQLPSLMSGELRAISLAEKTFVCSDQDRRYLSRTLRRHGVVVVPNSVQVGEPLPTPAERTLLFLGTFGYQPNVNAAEHLIERIWPLVRREVPDAKLIIAGGFPENIKTPGGRGDNVELTGFVEDLEALYRRSRIVCTPILSGGGTRIKIIEAAAFGKPVVSTGLGNEGLAFRDGEELMIRDDPAGFAAACVALLEDDAECRRLGLAAHRVARERYDRRAVMNLIQRELQPRAD
jgi:glycosyltransferase involved in cell wall biosynthesis